MSLIYQTTSRRELREQFPDDEDYKKKIVNFYRNLSPTSSWGHLAGRLLSGRGCSIIREPGVSANRTQVRAGWRV